MADLPNFIPFDQVIDDITPQGGGLPSFIPNEMVIDDLPRSWGETATDLGKGVMKGVAGVAELGGTMADQMSRLFVPGYRATADVMQQVGQPNVPQSLEMMRQEYVGDPLFRQASPTEKVITQGIGTLPYAALGGGGLSAFGAGAVGETFKQHDWPEWMGQIVGGLGGGVAQGTISGLFKRAPKNAAALENRALGVTKAELAMSARREGLDAFDYVKRPDGTFERVALENPSTVLEHALETAKADGLLKNGSKPVQVFTTAATRQAELGDKIGNLIQQADEAYSGVPITPTYERAQKYIDTKARKVNKPKLQKMLSDFKGAMEAEGPVPVSVWQNEKIQLANQAYAAGAEFVKPFDDALAADLRAVIEAAVDTATSKPGELGKLNELHGSYQTIEKILRAAHAKGGLPDPDGFLANLFKTTGGILGGGITGATMGTSSGLSGVGGGLGLVMSAGAKVAQSPALRKVTSKTLGALGTASGKLPGIFEQKSKVANLFAPLGATNQAALRPPAFPQIPQGISPQAASSTESRTAPPQLGLEQKSSVPSPNSLSTAPASQLPLAPTSTGSYKRMSLFTPKGGVMPEGKDVKAVETEIDADPYYSTLYEVESSRNPNATTKESSAKGGFQLINATAKSLGVENPFDLKESFEATKRLTQEHQERFGSDPAALYSAHYLGAPLYAKVLKGVELEPVEAARVRFLRTVVLPKFVRIYNSKVTEA